MVICVSLSSICVLFDVLELLGLLVEDVWEIDYEDEFEIEDSDELLEDTKLEFEDLGLGRDKVLLSCELVRFYEMFTEVSFEIVVFKSVMFKSVKFEFIVAFSTVEFKDDELKSVLF